MSQARRPVVSTALFVVLALGCANPSAGAPIAQDGDLPSVEDQTFTPILQGDDPENAYAAPFFPEASYEPGVPDPSTFLGRPVGSRLAKHTEMLAAFQAWGEQPRCDVAVYARSYEGRELLRVIIASESNHERLAEIQADIHKLFDPRGLSDSEAQRIVSSSPAIAWMGYSIHGDETSGADAALAVAYHLIAGTDDDVRALLDDVVIVMDPMMNPDGRMRIVSMVEQSSGYRSNLDYASMHRGRWPLGRGNHYLFDMNRDWMTGVAPETRGRWRVMLEFPPQLFVDAHEMSGLDTFLTYPQSRPWHPDLPDRLFHWQKVFADDNAKAFDEQGWGYYTREWADAWYPGYSDSWGSMNGAIGILYEQGSVGGQPLMRASGEIVSYREAVHGQVVASMSNLRSLAANREAILTDYLAARRKNSDPERQGGERAFVFVSKGNTTRERDFLRALLGQGIEVHRATAEFEGADVVSSLGSEEASRTFPEGAWIVPAAQPQGAFVSAYLDFDPRFDSAALQRERESLVRKNESKVYDITAWDLGRGFDLDAYWCTPQGGDREPVESAPPPDGRLANPLERAYAWACDASDDASVRFVARALELGLKVHISDELFRIVLEDGTLREFPRGSFLLRRHENPEGVDALVARVVREARAEVWCTSTGRAPQEGPDLGGQHFRLLARPRVALLANSPVSSISYGHIWQLLDEQLGLPLTILDAQSIGSADLRRYNVLVVPPAGNLKDVFNAEALKTWVRGGGTLIGVGRSAAAFTGESFGLSAVVLRRNALEDLEGFAFAAEQEAEAREVKVDESALWDPLAEREVDSGKRENETAGESQDSESASGKKEGGDPDAKRRDRWMRRFAPAGVILRARLSQDDWITSGCGDVMPVFSQGSAVLLSRTPISTPVRLDSVEELRLGGLLWPEARERLADSAWLTLESVGRGQVILFSSPPTYRGIFRGTARLLANGVVLGPGAGASQPLGW